MPADNYHAAPESIEIRGGTIVDPMHPLHGRIGTLRIEHGRFVHPMAERTTPESTMDASVRIVDASGSLVMAGGIDIHTHIGGGKVNLARLLMTQQAHDQRSVWPSGTTGELYNQMGYTACFEPAMLLPTARHTHLELADTPHLDSGAYVVLGNEDWLLRALSSGIDDEQLAAVVGWSVRASQALAVKVVNPGGINAFKYNQRSLDVDQPHVRFGVTPRDLIRRLTAAVDQLGLPHPLHVHASNLGLPGNLASTLATLDASEGRRIHLTHAQFHCYTAEGPMHMGSGAEQLADHVNRHGNVTLDVGQVMFGRTITISADASAQYRNRGFADPKQWLVSDLECQSGCGVVPIRYRDQLYVNSLQWTIGLELMLLVQDPWRVFLTTDHPNGGPFTCYPHLMRLLMDRSFRVSQLERLHPLAAERSCLRDIEREYTLEELAIVTRNAPARILGLADRGSLRPGAIADAAIYPQRDNWESTFQSASHVFKRGVPLVLDGLSTGNAAECETLVAKFECDFSAAQAVVSDMEQALQMPAESLWIGGDEMLELIRRPLACQSLGGGGQHAG